MFARNPRRRHTLANKWIAYGKSWREFSQSGLSNPGTLVEVSGKQYMIGDINDVRGVCDDCTAFNGDARVDRYCILVEKTW